MTRTVSETSLVSSTSPVQLENSQIVLHDEDENSNVLNIDEYCSNREVVNLENAAVNIDNSNDVIIGPVTQFNVNGNVTIYSNGNDPNEAINGTVNQEHQSRINFTDGAKLGKCENSESEEQDQQNVKNHKKIIKILVSISFAILLLIAVVVLILHYTNVFNDNSDYIPTEPGGNGSENLGSHQVIDRTQWGGRDPKSYETMKPPVPMVIIKHTGGGPCFSFQICAGKLQSIQSNSVSQGYPDIKYSFLIGGDGNIYVGRGWDVQPQQIRDTIDIAFIGSYAYDNLTESMIEAAHLLLQDGVDQNKLAKDYKLVAHNQTMNTESPGDHVYKEIITWPHYDGSTKMGKTLVKGAGKGL